MYKLFELIKIDFYYDNFCNFKLLIREVKYYSWYVYNINNVYIICI